MLAARFRRRGVSGISRFGVERRSDCWVATLRLGPDGDDVAVRDAAAPLVVEVEAERAEAVRTVRLQRAATDTEPAHRALALRGVAITLAALRGPLRRAKARESCDFLVGETQVRLGPEHRIGPPGRPVVLDAAGHPFAEEGDTGCCVGGFLPTGPVRGETPVFHAGELRANDAPGAPETRFRAAPPTSSDERLATFPALRWTARGRWRGGVAQAAGSGSQSGSYATDLR